MKDINLLELRLKAIDSQLTEMLKKDPDRIIYINGQQFKMPSFSNSKFNVKLYMLLCTTKREIVDKLYSLKSISEEEYKKFYLAESPHFTPQIINK